MPHAEPANSKSAEDVVLRVENLHVNFRTNDGVLPAVRGVSFALRRGRTLALVGESGSGKSVTSFSILRLIQKPGEIVGGKIIFSPREGQAIDLLELAPNDERLFKVRGGKIAMIFQEPMTALSPVHTVGNQLREAILLHRPRSRRAADELAVQMLGRVGIADAAKRLRQYPFEFSGGMRQRVVIAMALVCQPEVLIADEPTTALDVTIQAQILTLIRQLQREMATSVIFITHDLGVVAQVADDVAVMQQGRIVESAGVRALFAKPYHPYTRRLLAAVPHAARDPKLQALLQASPVVGGMPQGWSVHEPAVVTNAESMLVRLAEDRELLIWRSDL